MFLSTCKFCHAQTLQLCLKPSYVFTDKSLISGPLLDGVFCILTHSDLGFHASIACPTASACMSIDECRMQCIHCGSTVLRLLQTEYQVYKVSTPCHVGWVGCCCITTRHNVERSISCVCAEKMSPLQAVPIPPEEHHRSRCHTVRTFLALLSK